MYTIQAAAPEIENIRAALVVIAVIAVIFWRAVLRALIAIIAVTIVVAVGAGVLVILQGIH